MAQQSAGVYKRILRACNHPVHMNKLDSDDIEWIIQQKMAYTSITMAEAIKECSTLLDLSEVEAQIQMLKEEGWDTKSLEPLTKLAQARRESIGANTHISWDYRDK